MKPQEINPKDTTRADAFELWMNAPNPMVTFFKKIDVTNLVHISRKYKWKFNMLLCWCTCRTFFKIASEKYQQFRKKGRSIKSCTGF